LRREFELLFGAEVAHAVGRQENRSPGRRGSSSPSAASR
jgi:hypothetical protein